jgi:hypothetical protein
MHRADSLVSARRKFDEYKAPAATDSVRESAHVGHLPSVPTEAIFSIHRPAHHKHASVVCPAANGPELRRTWIFENLQDLQADSLGLSWRQRLRFRWLDVIG